jgi:hypothetical protein
MKNEEKGNFFNNKKNDDNFKWKQTKGDMSFYNYDFTQNYPLIIDFSKFKSKKIFQSNNNVPNSYNKKLNEDEEEEENYMNLLEYEDEEKLEKQNFDEKHFCEFLQQKRLNKIYPKQEIEGFIKNKLIFPTENNSFENNHSIISNSIIPLTNEPKNDIIDNGCVEQILNQFINTKDNQNKSKLIKKLLVEKKKIHKEKLEYFYKEISIFLKGKIEDIKEWISLEEKLMRIENLSSSICKELNKYIKVQQSGKSQLDNITSKDFLRVHFIGSIKVKMNDYNLTLKNYK